MIRQMSFVDVVPEPKFDGQTCDAPFDSKRLSGQLEKVYRLMIDGEWRTLAQIRTAIGAGSEAAISARLRDLRKPKFGSHTVERRRHPFTLPSAGLFQYRLV